MILRVTLTVFKATNNNQYLSTLPITCVLNVETSEVETVEIAAEVRAFVLSFASDKGWVRIIISSSTSLTVTHSCSWLERSCVVIGDSPLKEISCSHIVKLHSSHFDYWFYIMVQITTLQY